ncbi:hypothetical protein EW146_g7612 [Bondarzewia mesenterica]|uniref:DUF6699 domain-containing protein n=1 Tax=Bondarzewia mesenterica TaxID=1095465 RepID=A0A4S4LM36_9AGAM|nr:hypothetical protein EW146_g7612 [Bondarzewia mesenterica]
MANPYSGWPSHGFQQHPSHHQFPPSTGRPRSFSYPPPLAPPPPPPPQLPTAPPYYQTFSGPPFAQRRRHTISDAWPPPDALWSAPMPGRPTMDYRRLFTPPQLPSPEIHTLFNGNSYFQFLDLDLSAPTLVTRRRLNATQTVPLTASDLAEPVAIPVIPSLRIVCNAVPQWPLDLRFVHGVLNPPRADRAAIPYVTVGDVLHALHAHLQRDVTREEWAQLSLQQETEVSRAYTRRHKSFASDLRLQPQGDGVKRVDYLLRSYCFKGLVFISPENGVVRMKLIIGPP